MTMAYDLALLLSTTKGPLSEAGVFRRIHQFFAFIFDFVTFSSHFHWTPDWIFGTRPHQPIKTLSNMI